MEIAVSSHPVKDTACVDGKSDWSYASYVKMYKYEENPNLPNLIVGHSVLETYHWAFAETH